MFTNLFQLEKKPVTVFSSFDKGAPTLTTEAGSLKTLLKACLVTGYGDKTSLGWQMKYETEDKNTAVFVSNDEKSGKHHLKLDNTGNDIMLSVYQDMTSLTETHGTIVENQKYEVQNCSWKLIGHSRAFILLLDFNNRYQDNGYKKIAMPLLFGDLPKQNSHIKPISVFWCGRRNTNRAFSSAGLQNILFAIPNGLKEDGGTETSSFAYPFKIADGSEGFNLTHNYCKFNHKSLVSSVVLYEPVLSALPDGTWTFLPMIQPSSSKIDDVPHLGSIGSDAIKVVTGSYYYDSDNNLVCVVPTNWWWA